jgi:endonuclease YncB( thermonuclease family)
MRKSLLIPAMLMILLISSIASAETIHGMVRAVYDGDTISLASRGAGKVTVRLYGIDAPETKKPDKAGQPYGDISRRTLMFRVMGKAVTVDVKDRDQYNRIVGVVRLNGVDINALMVKEGMAWAYRRYLEGSYASEYISLEEQARRHRIGLWRQGNPQPPWEFRNGPGSGRKQRY